MHTDFGGHPGDHQVLNSAIAQNRVQVGGEEGTFTRFIDNRFNGERIKFWNYVVSGFAAHKDATHRTGIADASRAATANLLSERQVGQIRAMTFSCVQHLQTGGTPRVEQFLVGLDGTTELRDIVAEHFAKSAWLKKIPLHVDNDQCGFRRYEIKWVGLCLDTSGLPCIHCLVAP